MAIIYTGSGTLNTATLLVIGDDSSTVVSFDLSKAPFDIDFAGNSPSGFNPIGIVYDTNNEEDASFTFTFSASGTVITATANKALPSGVTITINLTFAYASL